MKESKLLDQEINKIYKRLYARSERTKKDKSMLSELKKQKLFKLD